MKCGIVQFLLHEYLEGSPNCVYITKINLHEQQTYTSTCTYVKCSDFKRYAAQLRQPIKKFISFVTFENITFIYRAFQV